MTTDQPLDIDATEANAASFMRGEMREYHIGAHKVLELIAALRAAQQQFAAEREHSAALQGVVNSQMETDSDQMATIARLECSLRVERAQREGLEDAGRRLVSLLADMHDGCPWPDWKPDPEHCMACLAFEESGIADLLAAAPGGQDAAGGEG